MTDEKGGQGSGVGCRGRLDADKQLDIGGENPWQTLSTSVVYDNGRLRLREDQVVQPDGLLGSYTFIEIPHQIVAIVPVTTNAQAVYLVRQWRYPWGRNSWEIPAGTCEPGEAALQGAQRELAEEIGMQARVWQSLGEGMSSATLAARYHLFLARDLAPAVGQHQRDGAEGDLIVRALPLATAIQAAMDGRIVHTITVAGLLRAARHLGV
jgi:8-oxo-dGTP pyrophosphatase MutT (NUDIX family)